MDKKDYSDFVTMRQVRERPEDFLAPEVLAALDELARKLARRASETLERLGGDYGAAG